MTNSSTVIASRGIKCCPLHSLQSGHYLKFCRACLLPPNCPDRPWFPGPLFLSPLIWDFPPRLLNMPWLLGLLIWNPNLLPLRWLPITWIGLGHNTSFNPSSIPKLTFFLVSMWTMSGAYRDRWSNYRTYSTTGPGVFPSCGTENLSVNASNN